MPRFTIPGALSDEASSTSSNDSERTTRAPEDVQTIRDELLFNDDDRQNSVDVRTVRDELLMDDDTSAGGRVTSPRQRPDSFRTMVNHQESTFNMDVLQETRPLVPQRRTDDINVRVTSPQQLPQNGSDSDMDVPQEVWSLVPFDINVRDEPLVDDNRLNSVDASARGSVTSPKQLPVQPLVP